MRKLTAKLDIVVAVGEINISGAVLDTSVGLGVDKSLGCVVSAKALAKSWIGSLAALGVDP